MQPRTVSEAQEQFDQLLRYCAIPSTETSATKISKLRGISAVDLVSTSLWISRHEFRHVTDGQFVRSDVFESVEDGAWVKQFIEQGVELLLCECESEHFAFATWHTPVEDTLNEVRTRLSIDYPSDIIDALIDEVYVPDGKSLPAFSINGHVCEDWYEFFGVLYAEIQVHALQRGFVNQLFKHGAGDRIRRTRVGWRAKRADKNFPKEMKVTHGTDTALWYFGDGVGLELLKREEKIAREWCEGWWTWLRGEGWGQGWEVSESPKMLKYIDAAGEVRMVEDAQDDWERGLLVWEIVRRIQKAD